MRYSGFAVGVTFVFIIALGGATIMEDPVFMSSAVASAPTPELAEREQRSCVTCHTAVGRAELNDAGIYYREHRTFEDYPGELPERRPQSEPEPGSPEEPAPDPPEDTPPN